MIIFQAPAKPTWSDSTSLPTYEKLLKEVPTYKLIKPSIVSERLKFFKPICGTFIIEEVLVEKTELAHDIFSRIPNPRFFFHERSCKVYFFFVKVNSFSNVFDLIRKILGCF